MVFSGSYLQRTLVSCWVTIVCASWGLSMWRVKRFLSCFTRKYLFLWASPPSFIMSLEWFCWWLLDFWECQCGLATEGLFPRLVEDKEKTLLLRKSWNRKKGGMWKTVLHWFFPCKENKFNCNSSLTVTPWHQASARKWKWMLFRAILPHRTAITMYTTNTITAAWP